MADPDDKQIDQLAETRIPTGEAGPGETAPNRGDTITGQKKSSEPNDGAAPRKKIVQLGDFRLEKKLGQGGMGEVFLATQVSLDRRVALKVLSKELAKKPGFVERFVREARAMARIDHPNAVKVYAADSDKGLNYVAIEFMDGCSLQDVMDRQGRLSIGDAVHVTLACADALAHAHELNLIHRDIKPDNILVNRKGVVKVADFGLAKALDDEDMSMTQSGTGLGTPLYMPPEQARDAKNVDHRTDIYALGCTLYYFVTGKLPFHGDTVLKLIMAKEKGQYESARKLNPEVPERLDLCIDRMIQKDPKHRYPDCVELIADLEKLGLENDVVSFMDHAEPGSSRSRSRARSTSVNTSSPPSAVPGLTRTSAEDAQIRQQASIKDATWYVRFTNAKGESQVKEMTTRQIQQGILSDALDVKAQAQRKDQKTGFLPLAGWPEFQDLMKKRLAKTTETVRSDQMKDMYAKLEKEQTWYQRKRWFGRVLGDVLGGFGLIVYLAAVGAALVGGYFLIRWLYPVVAGYLKIG